MVSTLLRDRFTLQAHLVAGAAISRSALNTQLPSLRNRGIATPPAAQTIRPMLRAQRLPSTVSAALPVAAAPVVMHYPDSVAAPSLDQLRWGCPPGQVWLSTFDAIQKLHQVRP